MKTMIAKGFGTKTSQLKIISKAYDRSVDRFRRGIKDEDLLPPEFKNSRRYRRLQKALSSAPCGSDDPKIRGYLNPRRGMKFLDVGSAANLIVKKLHAWPSTYYGVDISPKLIEASREYVRRSKVKIGGLFLADAVDMPFESGFFDICAAIGVLEYFDLPYIRHALKEFRRVLKTNGKIVLDMPNTDHPQVKTMIEFEEYLGRPRHGLPTNEEFEAELRKLFSVEDIDRSKIMAGYFARAAR